MLVVSSIILKILKYIIQNPSILLSITFVGCIFFYKAFSNKLDGLKEKSKIEIIFLIIFFVMLLIPTLYIDKREQSEQENRMLTSWKPLILNGKINIGFSKNFDNWFNDRFNLRSYFVGIFNTLKIEAAGRNEIGVYDKKNGFLYNSYEFYKVDIPDVDKNFQELYKLNDFCKNHNIKLYVLIVPLRTDLYPSEKSHYEDKNINKRFLDYLENEVKLRDIKIIYPYKELQQAGTQTFFQTENHWTDDGAYIGYKTLMQEIKKDFPDLKILNENDFIYLYSEKIRADFYRLFRYGQSCKNLGLIMPERYHKNKYRYYRYKDFKNLKYKIIDKDFHFEKDFYYPKAADKKVILIGTSQNENLTEFIPFTFKKVKRIRINGVKGISEDNEFKILKYYKKTILDYKPDIMIFGITYANIDQLYNLFNME